MIKVRNYNLFKNNSKKNYHRKKNKSMKLCRNKKFNKSHTTTLGKASKKNKRQKK